jgi:4-hydroxyproline epimerase
MPMRATSCSALAAIMIARPAAKMAVLHARGELKIGEDWRQESVTGSLFTGWLKQEKGGDLIPYIRGTAFVTGESTLRFDPADPFRLGLEA